MLIIIIHMHSQLDYHSFVSLYYVFPLSTKSLYFAINRTETEYVSQILTKIKRFAQHHSCHVWFVAHPRQVIKFYIIS